MTRRNPSLRPGLRTRAAVLALVLCAAFAPSAGAVLIETDRATLGDGELTLDTATGLYWLDIDLTLGLSVDDLVGGAGGWLTTAGYRFATLPEVVALYNEAGIVDGTGAFTAANFAGVVSLLNLVGCTFNCALSSAAAQGFAEFDPTQANVAAPFIQRGAGSTGRSDYDAPASLSRNLSSATLGEWHTTTEHAVTGVRTLNISVSPN